MKVLQRIGLGLIAALILLTASMPAAEASRSGRRNTAIILGAIAGYGIHEATRDRDRDDDRHRRGDRYRDRDFDDDRYRGRRRGSYRSSERYERYERYERGSYRSGRGGRRCRDW